MRTKSIPVLTRLSIVLKLCFLGFALNSISSARLSAQEEDPSPHSEARLVAETMTLRPGEPFPVAFRIALDPGWHSYWVNPGDAGQPASIDWELPAGFRSGDIRWPYPHLIEALSTVSYGYNEEVVLLTEIVPPRFLTTGQMVAFSAEAHWLVCANICLPARARLEIEVEIADSEPQPDRRWESFFAAARARLPQRAVSWSMIATENKDSFVLSVQPAGGSGLPFDDATFFARERGVIAHGAPQVVTKENGVLRLSIPKSRYFRGPLGSLKGVLVLDQFVGLPDSRTRALVVDAALKELPSEGLDNSRSHKHHTEEEK